MIHRLLWRVLPSVRNILWYRYRYLFDHLHDPLLFSCLFIWCCRFLAEGSLFTSILRGVVFVPVWFILRHLVFIFLLLFNWVSLGQQFTLLLLQCFRPYLLIFDLALEFLDPRFDGHVILFELRLASVLLVQQRALRVIGTLLRGRLRNSFGRYV